MKKTLKIAIAQINCTVGDLDGNQRKICEYIQKASAAGADIVSFPELAITGYPPEDLLLKKNFIDDNIDALKRVSKCAGDIVAVVGYADRMENDLFNAAAVIYRNGVKGVYRKMMLPNYGVFDEKRYFKPGAQPSVFKMGDIIFGINICEDIWHKEGPLVAQVSGGAGLIININSSPFHAGKGAEREELIRNRALTNGVVISYVNLVGGQDELVFDGQSMIADKSGRIIARAQAFREDLLLADIELAPEKCGPAVKPVIVCDSITVKVRHPLPRQEHKKLDTVGEIYNALLLGLKDYVEKNGFRKVVLGLSGGVDSSLVSAIAADALGPSNVTGVYMPTRYSSQASERDARAVASNLGIKFMNISIEPIFKLYLLSLEPHFTGMAKDIAEENLQARIRGNMLMALSNKFGWLVLATGNKSEMSTGYATLYGDMAGGLAVIKDVPKDLVYKLVKFRNSRGMVIPGSVLTKEPTAELKANQKDSDTLPAYDILDPILKAYVEEDKGINEMVSSGLDREAVLKTVGFVDKSEYKRRQSPPGIKITPKAFGRDRRMPITNKYRQ